MARLTSRSLRSFFSSHWNFNNPGGFLTSLILFPSPAAFNCTCEPANLRLSFSELERSKMQKQEITMNNCCLQRVKAKVNGELAYLINTITTVLVQTLTCFTFTHVQQTPALPVPVRTDLPDCSTCVSGHTWLSARLKSNINADFYGAGP